MCQRADCTCTSSPRTADPKSDAHFFKPQNPEQRKRVQPGRVYRIRMPDNRVMNGSTILIIHAREHNWAVCKFVQRWTVETDSEYEQHCAPVNVHTTEHPSPKPNHHIDQAECHALTIFPEKKTDQRLHSDCLIDLQRSYDVGNEEDYEFVYCGRMEADSFQYAKKKHYELYNS